MGLGINFKFSSVVQIEEMGQSQLMDGDARGFVRFVQNLANYTSTVATGGNWLHHFFVAFRCLILTLDRSTL